MIANSATARSTLRPAVIRSAAILGVAILAAIASAALPLAIDAAVGAATMPRISRSTVIVAQLQKLFASLSAFGWIGADGAYSTQLPDSRIAWVFGDTLTPGARAGALGMVHNSLVIISGGKPRVYLTPIPGRPDGSFYWPGSGHATGRHGLSVLCHRVIVDRSGFHIIGTSLARLDINTGRLLSLRAVPGANGKVPWGNAVTDVGRYTYIYGVEYQGSDLFGHGPWLHIARVPVGRLDARWKYYTGSGWSNRPSAARRILSGVSGSPSLVNLSPHGLYLVSQAGQLSHRVLSWRAASPVGPFTAKHTVYTIPDMGPQTFTYLAHPAPPYATHAATIFAYSTNTMGGLTPGTATLYRPRFFVLANAALQRTG
jgi:hypothetical protein